MHDSIAAERPGKPDMTTGRAAVLGAAYLAGILFYLLIVVQGVEAMMARQSGAEVGEAVGSLLARLIPVFNVWLIYRMVWIPHRAFRLCFGVAATCTFLLIALGVADLIRVL